MRKFIAKGKYVGATVSWWRTLDALHQKGIYEISEENVEMLFILFILECDYSFTSTHHSGWLNSLCPVLRRLHNIRYLYFKEIRIDLQVTSKVAGTLSISWATFRWIVELTYQKAKVHYFLSKRHTQVISINTRDNFDHNFFETVKHYKDQRFLSKALMWVTCYCSLQQPIPTVQTERDCKVLFISQTDWWASTWFWRCWDWKRCFIWSIHSHFQMWATQGLTNNKIMCFITS